MPSRTCGVDCRPSSVLRREGGAVCRSSGAVCKVADVLCKARVMRCKASDTLCKKATTVCKEHDILRKGVAKLCRHPALICQPREFACSPTAKVSFPCPVPRAPCPVPRAPAGGSNSCRLMSRKRSCEFLNLPVSILNPHHASTKNFGTQRLPQGWRTRRMRLRDLGEGGSPKDGIPGLRVDCKASGPLSASYFTNFSSVSVLRKATSAFLSSLLSRMPVGGCLARLGSSVGPRRRL